MQCIEAIRSEFTEDFSEIIAIQKFYNFSKNFQADMSVNIFCRFGLSIIPHSSGIHVDAPHVHCC